MDRRNVVGQAAGAQSDSDALRPGSPSEQTSQGVPTMPACSVSNVLKEPLGRNLVAKARGPCFVVNERGHGHELQPLLAAALRHAARAADLVVVQPALRLSFDEIDQRRHSASKAGSNVWSAPRLCRRSLAAAFAHGISERLGISG